MLSVYIIHRAERKNNTQICTRKEQKHTPDANLHMKGYAVNNTPHPTKETPINHSRQFLDKAHAKAKELGLRPSTIYKLGFLEYFNESTFTRLWNNTQSEPRVELEVAIRLSRVLGLNLSDAIGFEIPITSPLVKTADAEISRNTSEVLVQRRERIEELNAENEALRAELKEKDEKLLNIHAEYNRRIDALYTELKSCRDKLDEANQKLIDKTEKRSDKILELLESFVIRGE